MEAIAMFLFALATTLFAKHAFGTSDDLGSGMSGTGIYMSGEEGSDGTYVIEKTNTIVSDELVGIIATVGVLGLGVLAMFAVKPKCIFDRSKYGEGTFFSDNVLDPLI